MPTRVVTVRDLVVEVEANMNMGEDHGRVTVDLRGKGLGLFEPEDLFLLAGAQIKEFVREVYGPATEEIVLKVLGKAPQ